MTCTTSPATIDHILHHYYSLRRQVPTCTIELAVEDALEVLALTVPDRAFFALVRRVEQANVKRQADTRKQRRPAQRVR